MKTFFRVVLPIIAIASQGISQVAYQWNDSSQYSRVLVNANEGIGSYLTTHPDWFVRDKVVTDFGVNASGIGMQAAQTKYASLVQVLQSRGMYVGTYTSGTTVQPESEEPRWPYDRVPIEWMPGGAIYTGSWPGQPNRKIIDVRDAPTRHALQAGISRLWSRQSAPIRFVDNAGADPSTGATQPWQAYCQNIAEIRSIADSLGSKVIFNIALNAGMLSDTQVQQLIQAVGTHGIMIEEPWAPAIRARPDLTRQTVTRYRQLLDTGMGIVLLSSKVPGRTLAQWVRTWRKPGDHLYIGGSFFEAPDPAIYGPGSLVLVPTSPCRIADTRNADDAFGGPELAAGSTRDFVIANGNCNIPANALAFSLNVTAVPDHALGTLTTWATGEDQPALSTLSSDGRIKGSAAIVPAGLNGAISVYVSDATHLVMDINGYFVEGSGSTAASAGPVTDPVPGLGFYSLPLCRIVDTRDANSPFGGPLLAAAMARSFSISSSACLPSGVRAQAYSLNFTVIPRKTLGYLTAWPADQAQPEVATLNDPTGTTTANAAIVPTGTDGNISVFVTDDTDLLIDISGYFGAPGPGGLSLYLLTPCQVMDTLSPVGSPPFAGILPVNVLGTACNVWAAAEAYLMNATVAPAATLGYLTLWPNGQYEPAESTLHADDGAITSNMAIVPTTTGWIDVLASDPTHLSLDISGYLAP